MGRVRRTPTARKDYLAVWAYVAEHGGPNVADALIQSFDAHANFPSDHPGAGPTRPELRPRLRSFPVGRYLLFYRRARGGIELVRVVHGARDLASLFPRR